MELKDTERNNHSDIKEVQGIHSMELKDPKATPNLLTATSTENPFNGIESFQ